MPTLHERKTDISIIVPVYNLEAFLEPLLETLKMQDLGDYTEEIIFVLNNCTDGSENVIRESGIECKILNCTTQGCGPARNAALDVAVGEYIWTMDGDDWLMSKTAIKQALDKAYAENLDILRIPFSKEKFGGDYYSMTWQYLIKREFIGGIRFPDYQPGEDGAFMDDILEKAGYNRWNYLTLPCIDETLYYYNYMREGSNMYRFLRLKEQI